MKSSRILTWALLSLFLTFAASSCKKKNKGDGYGTGGTGGGDIDYVDVTPLPDRDESVSYAGPGSDRVSKSEFTPIYFAFDSYEVDPNEMSKVRAVSDHLGINSANVLIAGFTDSVGTEEYNRVLGERRALAVREALIAHGIQASRIQTVSFGEDMPAEPGNHSKNRRAEFGIVK